MLRGFLNAFLSFASALLRRRRTSPGAIPEADALFIEPPHRSSEEVAAHTPASNAPAALQIADDGASRASGTEDLVPHETGISDDRPPAAEAPDGTPSFVPASRDGAFDRSSAKSTAGALCDPLADPNAMPTDEAGQPILSEHSTGEQESSAAVHSEPEVPVQDFSPEPGNAAQPAGQLGAVHLDQSSDFASGDASVAHSAAAESLPSESGPGSAPQGIQPESVADRAPRATPSDDEPGGAADESGPAPESACAYSRTQCEIGEASDAGALGGSSGSEEAQPVSPVAARSEIVLQRAALPEASPDAISPQPTAPVRPVTRYRPQLGQATRAAVRPKPAASAGIAQAMEAGVSDYLVKPVAAAALGEMLAKHGL